MEMTSSSVGIVPPDPQFNPDKEDCFSLKFEGFKKIPRWFREVVISEKIDGTNAQIMIDEDGTVQAASKNRIITPADDNAGFARWVSENLEELRKLGPGRHYGEWWGKGIGRNYSQPVKRFSLFNSHRWGEMNRASKLGHDVVGWPKCCDVVPVLYRGILESFTVNAVLSNLKRDGSVAAPGFMRPEGLIIWHDAAKQYFKVTCG